MERLDRKKEKIWKEFQYKRRFRLIFRDFYDDIVQNELRDVFMFMVLGLFMYIR